jgi:hypothetical protein
MLVVPCDVKQPQVQDTTPKFQDVIAAATPKLSNDESCEMEEPLTKYRDIFSMKNGFYRQKTECTTIYIRDSPDQFANPQGGSI